MRLKKVPPEVGVNPAAKRKTSSQILFGRRDSTKLLKSINGVVV